MSRKLVSREELQSWMNSELQKYEECQGCKFGGVTPLKKPDETGCNWSDSIYINSGGVPEKIYLPGVNEVMAAARKHFNLK